MSATHANNLLRQKASTARKERESREMTPARALRLALARTAGSLWELPLDVRGIEQAVIGLEDLGAHMSDDMLLVLLDGPDGARGAAAIDRKIVTAMVEVQTIGTVSPKEPAERDLTPTDAALIAPWLDGALERADVTLCGGDEEAHAAAGADQGWMIGYRFGAMAENTRALALALDAPDLHCLSFDLDVGVGMRSGALRLLMPTVPPGPAAETGAGPVDADRIRDAMEAIPADLQVVAGRLSLTLAQASALKPGDCLPVQELLLTRAELRTPDGSCHGTARLGKLDGKWAIRLGAGEAISAPPGGEEGRAMEGHDGPADGPEPRGGSSLADMRSADQTGQTDQTGADSLPARPDEENINFE